MRKTTNCLNCAIEFRYETSQEHGKYCSNKCQGDHRFETVLAPKVERGEGGSRLQRTYLAKRRGWRCEVCEIADWMGRPLSFHVDHKDGNPDNNCLENIRLICPNCHSQTETYGNKNGNKRPKKNDSRNRWRRGIYTRGKLVLVAGVEPAAS